MADTKFNPIHDAPVGQLIWIEDWPIKHTKKHNQMESLPAREFRNTKQTRISQPNYDTALAVQNAKRNMVIFRKDSLKLVSRDTVTS